MHITHLLSQAECGESYPVWRWRMVLPWEPFEKRSRKWQQKKKKKKWKMKKSKKRKWKKEVHDRKERKKKEEEEKRRKHKKQEGSWRATKPYLKIISSSCFGLIFVSGYTLQMHSFTLYIEHRTPRIHPMQFKRSESPVTTLSKPLSSYFD